jgi:hypothetical protein
MGELNFHQGFWMKTIMKNLFVVAVVCFLGFRIGAQVSFTISSSPNVGGTPFMAAPVILTAAGTPELFCSLNSGNSLCILTNQGQRNFVVSGSLTVGNSPHAVVFADINGDGLLDMAVANYGDGTISILTNNGSSGFVSAATLSPGGSPASVVIADVNGDGKPDLICANYGLGGGNTLSVYTNDGSGGFSWSSSPTVGSGPVDVMAVDVNGDRKLDLVCANLASSTLTVLTNDGTGNFVLAETPSVGSQPFWFTAADVNGDGKVDLVSANRGDGTLTVLTNDGSGGMVFSATLSVGAQPQGVTAADIDGDGSLDLISANCGDNTLTVLTNNGTGVFGWAATLAVGDYPIFVTAVDVNGDGKLDLITANNGDQYNLTILTNDTVFPLTPPSITSQPVSQTNAVGYATTFSALATGTQPMAYQWRFEGTNLLAATNSSLVLTNLWLSQSGNYDVVVTNNYGSVTSSVAKLDVEFIIVEVNGQYDWGTVDALASSSVAILGGYPGGFLFYTLDGSAPTTSSTLYTEPFTVTNTSTIKVLSVSTDFMEESNSVPVAVMIVPAYALQTSVMGNGTLSINPAAGMYASNSVVTLTAAPGAHWTFDHWAGDVSGNQNPLSLTMDGPYNVQAVFVQDEFPVTVSTPGGGTVAVNGQSESAGTYYTNGTVLTLTATPKAGWTFVGWQGSVGGTNNPLTLTVGQTNTIQAIFGTYVGTAAAGGTIVLSATNPVPYGTTLELSAVANPGNYFVGWTGNGSGSSLQFRATVVAANPTFGAEFATLPAGKYSLSVAANGGGYVSANPSANYYSSGAAVTLTAYANQGNSFFSWSGDGTGTKTVLSVVMTTNKVIQANFGAGLQVGVTPLSQAVLAGSNAVLTASALGVAPIVYQWFGTQGAIGRATNSILTITNVQPTNAGSYWVVVSNTVGVVTSAVAAVTVIGAPVITNEPVAAAVIVGHGANFAVGAVGWPALAYQWQLNGALVAGATNAVLALSNALPREGGLYSVAITNVYGSVTSTPALLTVLPLTIAMAPGLVDGQLEFSFDTASGLKYEVEYSTNLVDWYPWLDLDGNGEPFTLSDPGTGESQKRFYRVMLTPP